MNHPTTLKGDFRMYFIHRKETGNAQHPYYRQKEAVAYNNAASCERTLYMSDLRVCRHYLPEVGLNMRRPLLQLSFSLKMNR